ncbi:MAG: B12-binding domain-containing radical SAM protein [Firmicutes bacterium]|nr:B12-binding domain-containing radical SAM protein [Bacillota bacterium]
MKILLVQPPLPKTLLLPEILDFGLRFTPLSLGYLAAVLEKNGYEVEILDLHVLEKSPEDFRREFLNKRFDYDVVGITSTTISYPNALRLAALIKNYSPEIKIVLGGSHVSFTVDDTFQESKDVDIIVIGEGECTLLEIVQCVEKGMDLERVPGIAFRKGPQVIKTETRSPESNLDSLPFPARHLMPMEKYATPAIVASRGCPRQCIFCSAGAFSHGRYRVRGADSIINELSTLDSLENVAFYDNTFSGNYERSIEICRAIINKKLEMVWSCELRADTADKYLLELMYQAGCRSIQYGVESGNEKVLADIKKHITKEQVNKAVDLAQEAKFEVACSFTIGHPSDTQESILETADYMKELARKGVKVVVGIVVPYPGTTIRKNAEVYGLQIHDNEWEKYHPSRPVISTPYLTKRQIGELYMKIVFDELLSSQNPTPLLQKGAQL